MQLKTEDPYEVEISLNIVKFTSPIHTKTQAHINTWLPSLHNIFVLFGFSYLFIGHERVYNIILFNKCILLLRFYMRFYVQCVFLAQFYSVQATPHYLTFTHR